MPYGTEFFPLEPTNRHSVESGLITESAVSDYRSPPTSVSEAVNFHFDTIGAATLRKGTTLLGQNLSSSITGLYQFLDSSGANSQLLAVTGGACYYLVGNSFTSVRGGLATNPASFTTFLNNVFMVNGSEATATWTGAAAASFITNGNSSGAPVGKYIDNYRSRVWITGNATYPDRVFYSSTPTLVATPVITWDQSVSSGQWIDIAPQNGESNTAIINAKNSLLVFKNNSMFRIFNINKADPDPQYYVGTYSQESVVKTPAGIFFHHPSGFYQYDLYGFVNRISQPIRDIVGAITLANYSKVAGWIDSDWDHVCWAVGNVTYKGVTYTNMVVRYTISTKTWTHYSYPTQALVSFQYNDGSALYRLIGDNSGNVLKYDTGIDDNGTPIFYSLVHQWDYIDGFGFSTKNVTKIFFSHTGGTGSKVATQQDVPITNDWKPLAPDSELKQGDTGFNNIGVQTNRMRVRISGVSTGQPFQYRGYEIPDPAGQLQVFE